MTEVKVYTPHCEDSCLYKTESENAKKIFLAGTIDVGNSDNWQNAYIQNTKDIISSYNSFIDYDPVNVNEICIYNPRRDKYDEKDMDYQMSWEFKHLKKADIIYMNFLPDSQSPITLLELGLFASSGKLYVTCPKEYWRYDNVRFICKQFEIPFRHNEFEKFKPLSIFD